VSTPVDPGRRADAVRFLARERWARLVRSAHAAGPDAEDAVQDVLERLAAGAGMPPADPERLTAYAAVAVRRRAHELATRRRIVEAAAVDVPGDDPEPAAVVEQRRLLTAYAGAVARAPVGVRQAVVLDAAGWSRGHVAAACGLSERAVKRLLETHRAPVLVAAARAADGTDCERLAETIAVCVAGHWRPRRNGPVSAHLSVCASCRAAVARARATRAALRALFPAPTGLAPPISLEAAAVPLVAGSLGGPWLVGLAVSAAVSAGALGVVARDAGRAAPAAASAPVTAAAPIADPPTRADRARRDSGAAGGRSVIVSRVGCPGRPVAVRPCMPAAPIGPAGGHHGRHIPDEDGAAVPAPMRQPCARNDG
jgi:DNA-directed RNA polymerase specialized sigma24 family protein